MKRQGKKLVAGLLALLMVVTLLPMNALAYAEDATKAKATIDLFVGEVKNESFGAILDDSYADAFPEARSEIGFTGGTTTKTAAGVGANINTANGLVGKKTVEENGVVLDGSTEAKAIPVAKNSNFYLGVDLKYSDPTQGGISGNFSVAFEATSGAIDIADSATVSFANPILFAQMGAAKLTAPDSWADSTYTDSDSQTKKLINAHPSTSRMSGTDISKSPHAPTGRDRFYFKNTGSPSGYIPEAATWDTLLPMKAIGTGKVAITVSRDSMAGNGVDAADHVDTAGTLYTVLKFGDGWKTTDNYGVQGTLQNVNNMTQVNAGTIWINIISDDPTATIGDNDLDPKGENDSTMTITLAKDTFTAAAAASHFTLIDVGTAGTDDPGSEVTGAVKSATFSKAAKAVGDDTVVLTLDNTKLTGGHKYKVKIAAAALTKGTELTTTNVGTAVEVLDVSDLALTGTATYGETLTMTLPGDDKWTKPDTAPSTGVTYKWYRDDTAAGASATGNYTAIEGETGNTYTLGKDDVGNKIKCVISVDGFSGTAEAVTAAPVAKKALTALEAADASMFTGHSIMKDSTDKAVPGYVTMTAAKGVLSTTPAAGGTPVLDEVKVPFTATYDNVSTAGDVNDVTITVASGDLTLSGADAAYYSYTGALTLNNQAGTVVEEGYKISKDKLTLTDLAGTHTITLKVGSTTLNDTNGKVVGVAGDSDAATEFTVDGMGDYQQLKQKKDNSTDAYTVTTDNGGVVTVTGANTFTYKNTNRITGDDKVVVEEIELPIEPVQYEITADDLSLTGTITKTYDGTTDAPDGMTLTFAVPDGTSGAKDYSDVDEVLVTADLAFTAKAVGTTTVKLTNIQLAAGASGDDTKYYKLADALKADTGIELTIADPGDGSGFGITKATATSITTAALTSTTLPASVADLATSLGGQGLTVKTADGDLTTTDTLSKVVASATLQGKIQDWLDTQSGLTPEVADVATAEIDFTTGTSATVAGISQGTYGKITLTGLPEGATIKTVDDTTNLAISDDKTYLTVKGTATAAAEANKTITVEIPGADGAPATTFTVTLPLTITESHVALSQLTSGTTIALNLAHADMADQGSSDVIKNFETSGLTGADADHALTVSFTYRKGGGGGVSGYSITFDAQGYGEASNGGYAYTNSEDMLDELPEIENVVKGAQFICWSTVKGDANHKVNLNKVYTEDVTLYAVYEGYMEGNGKGNANPRNNVTRAELLKMLLIASGQYDNEKALAGEYGAPSFTDCQSGWYVPYVACGEKLAEPIIKGYDQADGTKVFKPNEPVTREEAATMIARAFGVTVTEGATTDVVTDLASTGDWAKDTVATLCEIGAINGYEQADGTYKFLPKNPITRAESATIINAFLGLTDEAKDTIAADTSIVDPFTDVKTADWFYEDIMFASLSVPYTYYSTEIIIPSK